MPLLASSRTVRTRRSRRAASASDPADLDGGRSVVDHDVLPARLGLRLDRSQATPQQVGRSLEGCGEHRHQWCTVGAGNRAQAPPMHTELVAGASHQHPCVVPDTELDVLLSPGELGAGLQQLAAPAAERALRLAGCFDGRGQLVRHGDVPARSAAAGRRGTPAATAGRTGAGGPGRARASRPPARRTTVLSPPPARRRAARPLRSGRARWPSVGVFARQDGLPGHGRPGCSDRMWATISAATRFVIVIIDDGWVR